MCSLKLEIVKVAELSKKEQTEIDQFIKTSIYGTIFQTIGWSKVLDKALNQTSQIMIMRKSGNICGTLLFAVDNKTKHFTAEEGPVLAQNSLVHFKEVYAAYLSYCQKLNARRIELHLFPEYSFSPILRAYSYRAVRSIKDSKETIWASLNRKSTRYSIKNALKKNVQIIQVKDNDCCYHLHLARLSKRRGNCAIHLNHFIRNDVTLLKAIFEYLPRNCALFLAKVNGEYVASVLWLFFGQRAYYYDVGLNYSYKGYNAPDLLFWNSIEFLKNAGVTCIDLMGVNSYGNATFKLKWSDRLLSNRYYIWTRPDFYPSYFYAYPDSIKDVGHFFKSVVNHSRFS
jgi:lipid II:glycine glycyltransferase (peptidoglycan interpeptide bridge formation enzyme)